MSASDTAHHLYSNLASGISQSTVNAMVNALGLKLLSLDKSLYKPRTGFGAKLQALAQSWPKSSFVLDLGQLAKQGLTLLQLRDQIDSPELRSRITLCNSEGAISIGSRNLVKSLGFAELVADIDPRDALGGLKSLNDWIFLQAPIVVERTSRLPAFLKTVAFPSANEPARALIQRLSGQCAEILLAHLMKHLEVRDRSYHLKTYPACFLGLEACQYLQEQFRLVEAQAVSLGKALQELGLIYHVTHEQNFANERLYFRFANSSAADKAPALEIWNALLTQLDIKDRSYLGQSYPTSFVGSEALSLVAKKYSLSRLDAWIVLHRFEQLGFMEHVTGDHGFLDGNFYYRLNL